MRDENREIVLIEDDPDDQAFARIALERTGVPHSLRVFSDGDSAIEHFYGPDGKVPPALILLDLNLPRMDGKTILRNLRGNPTTARVPIVVLTSSRLEQDRIDAYCLGTNSYFVKPVDFDGFLERMRALATYWLGLNLAPPAFHAPVQQVVCSLRTAVPEAVRPTSARPLTEVVILDSNPRDREQSTRVLDELGVRTVVLEGYDPAVRFMRHAGGPPPLLPRDFPSLCIVDTDLDTGDGRDVLQALRYRADHHAVVVMFSRNCHPDYVSECYRLKVSSVLQKPDDEAAYRDAVRLLAYYWLHVNEPPPDPSWTKRALAHPG